MTHPRLFLLEPDRIVLDGVEFERGPILKKDFFSTNFLVRLGGRSFVVKHSYFNFSLGRPFRWLARFFSRHEREIYLRLQGIEGIPEIYPVWGRDFFLHEYIEGWPLSECRDAPPGFFERLRELVRRVHERGVAYADLSKRSNVIVTPGGMPFLIDFQISPVRLSRAHPFAHTFDPVVDLIQREDLYHVAKHKKSLARDEMTEGDWEVYRGRTPANRLHELVLRKPWLLVKRRIWPKGSDEKRQIFREGRAR